MSQRRRQWVAILLLLGPGACQVAPPLPDPPASHPASPEAAAAPLPAPSETLPLEAVSATAPQPSATAPAAGAMRPHGDRR